MYPDDVATTVEYHERLSHLRAPDPCEGEAGKSNSCFFLRKFEEKREVFWVNTETEETNLLAFFVVYKGQRELFCDLEIGAPHDPR